MYNENENNDLSRMNPEEHKEEAITTNFTMRDADSEETKDNDVYERREEVRSQEETVDGQTAYSQAGSDERGRTYSHSEDTNGSQPYGQQVHDMLHQAYSQPYGQPVNGASAASYGGQSGQNGQSVPNGQNSPNGGYSQPGYRESAPNRPPYGVQQGIPHYQERQYQRVSPGPLPPQDGPKPPRKKGGFAKKAAVLLGSALVFGVVAGGTMVGINWAAGTYSQKSNVEISQAETLPDAETTAADQASADKTAADETAGNPTVVAASMDVSPIVDKAMPSVVAITSKVIYESQTFFGTMQREGMGSGSGIIIGKNDNELLIVTNNHVVEGAEELKVTFIDQNVVDAAIKGTDVDSDLAVIAVQLDAIPSDTASQIAIANLGSSDEVKVGQGVVAIGNALGYGQSVTVGYISALDRTVYSEDGSSRDLIQTDAAINPGNSGGALLNMKGEVIGINAAKYSSTEVEGMGYAIPISKAQDIIDTLITRKTRTQIAESEQGYLGIQCKNIDALTSQQFGMPQGVFIYKIVEDGAAAQSDLREKDIITKFDGQSIKTYDDLTKMLRYYEGGSTVTVTVQSLENGQYVERNVDITLGKRPVETNETSGN